MRLFHAPIRIRVVVLLSAAAVGFQLLSLCAAAEPKQPAAAKTKATAKPSAAKASADWAQFRGPGGQGISVAQNLPLTWNADENVVWKAELPGAGTSSPILFGDRIYVTCYSGFNVPGQEKGDGNNLKLHLVAISNAGKILRTIDVVPQLPEQETIREEHGYASSTPAADKDRVVVFFGKTGVLAFDHQGRKLWQTSVGEELNGWGSSNSPVLYKNLVLINASVESESLVALNVASGEEIWRAEGIRESWNTPIIVKTADGRDEIVLAIAGKILGFDPTTGAQLWSCQTDIAWYMAPSLVSHGDVVYCIGGRSGGALAVRVGGQGDVTETHRLWTGKKGSNVSSPIYHDGHLYWMNDNQGIAYCAEAATGKIVYENRVEDCEQTYASPVLANGRLYCLDRQGNTHVLAAKPQFEELAVNNLGERGTFNASPAVAKGRIYLRSNKYLYCLGKKD